ncbi:MAG: hypothetical protein LBG12_11525 [Synergistaceae bacterium]|jgi:hypothetical protein|nr:hypothetical protein [Synergistaceae bacterium]
MMRDAEKTIGNFHRQAVMERTDEYPVYLHTQPCSFRAIKLYSDFGFLILRDPIIGSRKNDVEIALPYLKERIRESDYNNLRFGYAEEKFLRVVARYNENEF